MIFCYLKKYSLLLTFFASFILLNSCKKEEPSPVQPHEPVTIDEKVEALLKQMTLDEKVGQMTQAERGALGSDENIRHFFLGSLLSGGGSSPSDNSPYSWADMYDTYQSIALRTRLKIPLIYGVDAVHGHNNVKGAVIFPHNIGLGASRNPELVEKAANITAKEVAGTGIDWTFSPCIAVALNEKWGRTYESFGETAELSKMMAAASVKGYQGSSLSDNTSILACAKHYLGDGGTTNGIDQGNTQVDELTMRTVHLQGYISAIESGVKSIMVSFSSWNGEKMHGSKYWITDILKGELGFKGFVVTDWAGIDQLPGNYKNDIEISINAGIDMVMVPSNYAEFIRLLKELVNEGKVSVSRIDDAVRRILKVKYEMGLFEKPHTDRSLTGLIGSIQHREVARECVRQSLVLLKNDNNTLPISKTLKRIHVAGINADDIGNQCGGWTISWQGNSGKITDGTTILEAIKNTVSSSTEVTYSLDGSGADGADFGIVVLGEQPYAEGAGDRTNLSLSGNDLLTVMKFKNAGIPVVVILVSGRPMIIENVLNASDAFIAAWLPGTEGQGVADILFGDFAPTGKLPHSWPKTMSQIPINSGDQTYSPLFEYGYGLTY